MTRFLLMSALVLAAKVGQADVPEAPKWFKDTFDAFGRRLKETAGTSSADQRIGFLPCLNGELKAGGGKRWGIKAHCIKKLSEVGEYHLSPHFFAELLIFFDEKSIGIPEDHKEDVLKFESWRDYDPRTDGNQHDTKPAELKLGDLVMVPQEDIHYRVPLVNEVHDARGKEAQWNGDVLASAYALGYFVGKSATGGKKLYHFSPYGTIDVPDFYVMQACPKPIDIVKYGTKIQMDPMNAVEVSYGGNKSRMPAIACSFQQNSNNKSIILCHVQREVRGRVRALGHLLFPAVREKEIAVVTEAHTWSLVEEGNMLFTGRKTWDDFKANRFECNEDQQICASDDTLYVVNEKQDEKSIATLDYFKLPRTIGFVPSCEESTTLNAGNEYFVTLPNCRESKLLTFLELVKPLFRKQQFQWDNIHRGNKIFGEEMTKKWSDRSVSVVGQYALMKTDEGQKYIFPTTMLGTT